MLSRFARIWTRPPRALAHTSSHTYSNTISWKRDVPRSMRLLVYTGGALVGVVGVKMVDLKMNGGALTNAWRANNMALVIALDFLIRYDKNGDNEELHQLTAQRIHHVCVTNGGLYVKFAQLLALQANLLPPVYREVFAMIFDQVEGGSRYPDPERTFEYYTLQRATKVFDFLDKVPLASGSIATVHLGRLRKRGPNGEKKWVAVKLRRPMLIKQMPVDLWLFRKFAGWVEYFSNVPTVFLVDAFSDIVKQELDFVQEAENSELTRLYIENDKSLKGLVHVPIVYRECSNDAVLTTEFINDAHRINRKSDFFSDKHVAQASKIMLDLFGKMIFTWGWVHADAHPGNILIRDHPNQSAIQLVLLDHGSYLTLNDDLRSTYARLWNALVARDTPTVQRIIAPWHIAPDMVDILGSLILMEPYSSGAKMYGDFASPKDAFIALFHDANVPLPFISLARVMQAVQSNNDNLGSPVDRVAELSRISRSVS